MKKVLLTSIALFVCCLQTEAQKYFHIFQDGLVIKKILFSDVDSISVTEQEPHTINMWSNGSILQSYASEEVDSITVIDENGGPLSYVGIIGFNSELHSKNIGLLSNSTVSKYKTFVNQLPKKDGTILYYAVDSALYVLQNADIKTPLTTINFVTFTDGLDQGSLMKNPNYQTADSYLDAIRSRIKDTKYAGLKMDAYSIGLRGKDVTDVGLFKRNLASLASSDQNAFEVSSISDLRTRLKEIANKIINVNYRQTVSVKIPGADNGTIVRLTFDGYDAENSKLYIQGTLDLSDYSLRNVTYHGIKARSGSVVQGTKDGIFIKFTFRGLHQADEQTVLPTNSIRQYNCSPTSTTWQINSEFKPENDTQRIVSYSGTLIMLVLDCSSSLGYDFSRMQEYANEFINMVADNAMPFTLEYPKNVQAAMDDDDLAINVSWDAVRGADYYQIYRRKNGYYSEYELLADKVTACSWRDSSPLGGYNSYRVCAVGLGISSEFGYTSNDVDCSLDAPQNVQAVMDDTDYAIHLTWDAVNHADHYQIYRSNSSSYYATYELIADNVTSCSWDDKSFTGSEIYYKVHAISGEIKSSESNSAYVYLSLGAPQNAEGELVMNGDKFAINTKWDAVKYAECYQVYRSSYSGRYYNYSLLVDSLKSTSYLDESPNDGSNYYYIKAIGHGLVSSESNSIGEINTSKMPVPKNVTAELMLKNDKYGIKVSWDGIRVAEKYQVYRGFNMWGTYELIADDLTTSSWIDQSPLAGSNYYKIVAIGHGLTSEMSNSSAEVKYSTTASTEVTAELVLKDNALVINVSWGAVENAEGYNISRSNNFNGEYTEVAFNVKTNSWTDESPLVGSNYYKIVTVDHGLTSEPAISNLVNCSLATPKDVTANLAENKLAVNITWGSVTFAESYNVYRSSDSWFEDSKLVAEKVTSNSWTDNSPQNSNYYKVEAVGHGLISELSNASGGVSCSINIPTNLKAVLDDTDFVIHLTWDAVSLADHYQVYRSSSSYSGYELIADNISTCSWDDKSSKGSDVYYKVYAVCGEIKSSASDYCYIYCTLNTPENLKGELDWKNDKIVVNLSWDAVKYAECYQVYRSSSYSSGFTLYADSVKSTSYTDLNPNSGNYYKLRAIGHGLSSSQSNYIGEFKNSMPVPKNVAGELVLNDNNSLVISVTWDAIKIAETYQIFRSNSSSGSFVSVAEGVKTNSWTDQSPLKGSNYYRVVADGHGYTSSQSNSSAEVKCSLAAPTNIAGELTLTDNGFVIKVMWNAVKFAEGYTIYRSSSYSGTFTKLAENVTTSSWIDESPIFGNNFYRIEATGHGLTSAYATAQDAVNCSLDVPQNFKSELVVNGTKLAINVSWDGVEYAEKYNVYRCNSSSGTYSLVGENLTSTSWKDENPLSGYNYYKVEACGHGLTSQKSNYTSISYSISTPQNVTANMVLSNNQLVACVSWDAVTFAESYIVYRSSSYSSGYVEVARNVTSTSWNDESPMDGYNYYKVAAYGYGMTSSQSSYVRVNK